MSDHGSSGVPVEGPGCGKTRSLFIGLVVQVPAQPSESLLGTGLCRVRTTWGWCQMGTGCPGQASSQAGGVSDHSSLTVPATAW